MSEFNTSTPSGEQQKRWQPLSAIDRRVLGVLAEKAKTTPDSYPMSLNAICTGCNQKSNRSPIMQLEADVVEESLDRLRQMGAVGLVEGYGRVQKYRHYLYEWLGVDKVELAVMTELLLRGDQTVGELRARAARMEPIPDLAALRPVLDSLKAKGLIVSLTPEGRGHVVSHALYKPREMEILRAKYANAQMVEQADAEQSEEEEASEEPVAQPRPALKSAETSEIAELRQQLAELATAFEEMKAAHQKLADDVQQLREALGG